MRPLFQCLLVVRTGVIVNCQLPTAPIMAMRYAYLYTTMDKATGVTDCMRYPFLNRYFLAVLMVVYNINKSGPKLTIVR